VLEGGAFLLESDDHNSLQLDIMIVHDIMNVEKRFSYALSHS
jgi:hypothetical protein